MFRIYCASYPHSRACSISTALLPVSSRILTSFARMFEFCSASSDFIAHLDSIRAHLRITALLSSTAAHATGIRAHPCNLSRMLLILRASLQSLARISFPRAHVLFLQKRKRALNSFPSPLHLKL